MEKPDTRFSAQFLILEANGAIDVEEKRFENIAECYEVARRFLNLFKDDPYKRVARVVETNSKKVIGTFDSESNKLIWIGGLK